MGDMYTNWGTFTLEKAAFGSNVVDAFLFVFSSFYGNLTQARVIWEEGISFEEIPLWDLPVGERA